MKYSGYEKVAYSLGYYVDKSGQAFNPSGKKIGGNGQHAYSRFHIMINDGKKRKKVSVYIHRFQAFLKFGEKIYKKGLEVRHLDGNRLNNKWENIDIGTHSDNMMDIPKEERIKHASKGNKIYSDEQVKEMYFLYHRQGYSYRQLMDRYNISSEGTVRSLIKDRLCIKDMKGESNG